MTKTKHYNPSTGRWDSVPYMVKEHSVSIDWPHGHWLATVVVVPVGKNKKTKEGEESERTFFHVTGVRIEDISSRKEAEGFILPGRTWFYHFDREKISETLPARFQFDGLGKLKLEQPDTPIVIDGEKTPGESPRKHRFGEAILEAVTLARISHESWLEEKRAK